MITYERFIKNLLFLGFTWNEVEYYWRNPKEYEKLCQEIRNNANSSKKENEYLANI